MGFSTTYQHTKLFNFFFIFWFFNFFSFVSVSRLLRLKDDRNDEKRRKAMTLFTASPLASVVFSVRRPIETSTDDDCLGPHGVSSGFSRLLYQKTDRNQHGRRLSRSSRRLLRIGDSLRCVVNALLVKKFMKVSPIHHRFTIRCISASV